MAEAVLLAASVVILAGTVVLYLWRVRNPTWVRDQWLTQNGSPVISLVALVLGSLLVALVLAFGIAVMAAGRSLIGWGMICAACSGVVHVWVGVWIRQQPLP